MTWILALATFGVLTSIAVACRRAHLEAAAAFGDRLEGLGERPRLTAVAASPSPGLFVVVGEGEGDGGAGGGDHRPDVEPGDRRRHLRVVGA